MTRRHDPTEKSPRLVRAALACVLVSMVVLLGGCAEHAGMRVTAWTLSTRQHAEPIPVTLPAHLDPYLPRTASQYTLRTKVAIPKELRGRPLTLTFANFSAMSALFVDGYRAVPLDVSLFDGYRRSGPARFRVDEEASDKASLDLELKVEHRSMRSGWIDTAPELSATEGGTPELVAVHAFNTFAAVGALATGLVVVILYSFVFLSLSDKRRNAYGIFAIGGACGLFYPAFLLGLTQPVFGVYDAPVMAWVLIVGAVAAIHFSHAYLNLTPPSRVWALAIAASGATEFVARDPFVAVRVLGPMVIVVTAANATVQLILVLRLRNADPKPRNLFLIAFAWPLTAALGAPDFVPWLGLGEPFGGIRTACLGITIISLFQAVALSREHLLSLKRADELNRELGARVDAMKAKHREVEMLNDELRRQIAARSRELAEKLMNTEADYDVIPFEALEPGAVVEGRYTIVRTIGSGGMGAVYEVERTVDGRHFALKALSATGDSSARARFAREAQICANVNHPNVVSIVDVDVAKTGFLFLVMELVEGGTTLHEVRRRHRDNPWTIGVLAQAAAGIAAIHAAGIVHRDLKPANILLSRGADGRKPLVKISDFGISSLRSDDPPSSLLIKAAASADQDFFGGGDWPEVTQSLDGSDIIDLEYYPPGGDEPTAADGGLETTRVQSESSPEPAKRTPSGPLTETGIIFGTPQYMAAELTSGSKNATRSSDVFSLGIIAFEVLTGRRPFPEGPVSARLAGRPLPRAPRFSEAVPTLDPAICALLDRAMSHDPAARPSARDLADALRAAADRLAQ